MFSPEELYRFGQVVIPGEGVFVRESTDGVFLGKDHAYGRYTLDDLVELGAYPLFNLHMSGTLNSLDILWNMLTPGPYEAGDEVMEHFDDRERYTFYRIGENGENENIRVVTR